jgi:ABC-type glycerol-3-phosphate transport system permease component
MNTLTDNISKKIRHPVKKRKPNKFAGKKTPLEMASGIMKIFLIVALGIYCVSLLFPLYWLLINSFKTLPDYMLYPFSWPRQFVMDNYKSVFSVLVADFKAKNGANVVYGLPQMATYSLIYTFSASFICVAAHACVAYIIAKYKFWGRNFLFSLGIVIMIVPIVGSLPSAMVIRKALGIYNNMLLLLLTSQSTPFSGIYFLLLYAAFKGISDSYSEAAQIDGAGHFTVMFKIMLPMVLSSCAVIFVLVFLGQWNDYNTFLIWLPSYPSLSVGLYLFEQGATKNGRVGMPSILASFVVVIIPTTILYFAAQNIIMSKFTVGGMKG